MRRLRASKVHIGLALGRLTLLCLKPGFVVDLSSVSMTRRFCGHQTPPNSIVTDAREVLVLFRSNYNADSVENIGFKLLYRLGP